MGPMGPRGLGPWAQGPRGLGPITKQKSSDYVVFQLSLLLSSYYFFFVLWAQVPWGAGPMVQGPWGHGTLHVL